MGLASACEMNISSTVFQIQRWKLSAVRVDTPVGIVQKHEKGRKCQIYTDNAVILALRHITMTCFSCKAQIYLGQKNAFIRLCFQRSNKRLLLVLFSSALCY